MLIIESIFLMRQLVRQARREGKQIALVPTMGNLHNGHIRLVNEARERADIVVVSIFVNPMQFDCIDDLLNYPRTLKEDFSKLKKCYVDFVFTPTSKDLYPKGIQEITHISVPGISKMLEGAVRPKHFYGVATVISKLFNIVQPDIACFGEKDYQQLILIREMVSDMNYDIDVIGIPTVRDKDGLALSSRNIYLTAEQRKIAPSLNKIINIVAENLKTSFSNQEEIISFAKEELNKIGIYSDYIHICDADTLLEINNSSKRAVVLIAAKIGKIRLIDNKIIECNKIESN